MVENLRRRSFSPLPLLSRTTPPRYHSFSSLQVDPISGSPTQNMVSKDLSQISTPTPHSQNSPSISNSSIVSTPRGYSPA